MKKLLILIVPMLLLAACSKDKSGVPPEPTPTPGVSEDINLSFAVTLPAQAQPKTYALNDMDENFVSTVNVLAFKESGGSMLLADWAEAVSGSIEDVGQANKKKFAVKFTKLTKGAQYQFVVLANAKKQVDEVLGGGVSVGAVKETTLDKLKLIGVNVWLTDSSDGNYLNIPMWGESDNVALTEEMKITDLRLLRMVAKINITLDPTSGVRAKFNLKSVDLYNFNKDGRVVPDPTNLVIGTGVKADKPTNIGIHTQGPIVYNSASTIELLETIYTFESKVPYDINSDVEKGDVICLVIGGEYQGSATTTYYRLDIAKKNGTGGYDYMEILRNHNYKINITNVNSNGYGTSKEAFDSRAVNIDTEIEAWEEEELELIHDGQYQFGVNKSTIEFFMEGRSNNELVAFSDHPNGWKIDLATIPSWITSITPMSDNSGSAKNITITATALLATESAREDTFTIIANTLSKKIKVKQSNEPELSLSITPASVLFRKSGSQPKPVSITKFPLNTPVTITVTGDIVWVTGEAPDDSSGHDITSFSFRPEVNNTGAPRSSTITVSVNEGGLVKSETITVTQLATDMFFGITSNVVYPAEAGTRSFYVESATTWQLSKDGVSDPGNIIGILDGTEQPAAGTAVAYNFTLAANTTYGARTAQLYAKSSDLDFLSQMITIRQTYKPLYLNLNLSTVAFGVTAAAKSVAVNTNASWIVSNISNTKVLSTTTPSIPAVGIEQAGSSSALVDASGTVSLTPSVDYVGFGAAGTSLSSVVTVQSRNHAQVATPISKAVTVTRTVPSAFSVGSITPTAVAIGGGDVTAKTVASNAAWTLSSNLAGTTPYTHTAAEYNTISKAITIPENTTAWTGARTLTVSVASTGHTTKSITVTQPGYIFSYARGFPTSTIPQAGGTYNVVFKSASLSPAVYVRMASAHTVVSPSKPVPAITTAGGERTVSMVANASWEGDRTVYLQWSKDDIKWNYFSPAATVSQTGYYLNSIVVSPPLTFAIPHTSQTYTVKTSTIGYYPAIPIRILINGSVHKTGSIPAASLNSSASLILDANTTTANRDILVQYQHPEAGKWIIVTEGLGTQLAPEGLDLGTFWVMYPSKLPNVVMNLGTASAYCSNLGAGWRLPTYDSPSYELYAMVNSTVFRSAYTPVLNVDPLPLESAYKDRYYFWSSTIYKEEGVEIAPTPYRIISWFRASNTYDYRSYNINYANGRPICVKSK